MTLDNPILLAQIGSPHGVKGEVRVKPFTGDPMAIGDYGKLHTKDGRKFKVMRMRPSKNVLVVKFKGINFRDEAEALNGVELYVDRSMLPDDTDDDEFYVADMIGCLAKDENGTVLGKVLGVEDFGAGDLIEIAPALTTDSFSSKSWYLEFTRTNVPDIDLENRTITITPPEEVSERDEG